MKFHRVHIAALNGRLCQCFQIITVKVAQECSRRKLVQSFFREEIFIRTLGSRMLFITHDGLTRHMEFTSRRPALCYALLRHRLPDTVMTQVISARSVIKNAAYRSE